MFFRNLIQASMMVIILISCGEKADPKPNDKNSEAKFLIYVSWTILFDELRTLYDFGVENSVYTGRGFLTATHLNETVEEFWFEKSNGERVYVDADLIYNDMPAIWTPVKIDSGEYVAFGFTTSPICSVGNVYSTDGIVTGVSEESSSPGVVQGDVYLTGLVSKPMTLYDGTFTDKETVFRMDVVIDATSSNTVLPDPESPYQGQSIIVQKTMQYSVRGTVEHLNPLQ